MLCTIITLPPFRASLGFLTGHVTPFLIIAQILPIMFKGEFLIMVVEEDLMS